MDWINFRKQPHIQRLNENQQKIRLFNLHLQELDQEDYNYWVKGQQQEDENVILQENGFYLLQEDGSKINIYA